uniref:TGF_BETA_2 domain-containing protein n=1 Tax=Mesocestoides corti TaxID=53468 RepID=A0A5K3ENM5_MESCO
MHLYRSMTDRRGRYIAPSPYYADTVLAFLDEEVNSTHNQNTYFFNVTKLPNNTVPLQAEFHLYRMPGGVSTAPRTQNSRLYPQSDLASEIPPTHKATLLHPFIFLKLFYIKTGSDGRDSLKLLDAKRIPRHFYGWVVFNVNEALTYWLQSNQQGVNKGVVLKAATADSTLRSSPVGINFVRRRFHNADRLQPCLIIYCHDRASPARHKLPPEDNHDLAQDFLRNEPWRHIKVYMQAYQSPKTMATGQSLRRSKRNTVHFTKKQPATMKNSHLKRHCRRRKMVISFTKLNMSDWILAPVSYDAGMCSGPCAFPLGQEVHPTNHAVLQSIWARLYSPAQHIPPPRCVPHELEPLPMLYFETDNRIVLNHRPDMIVRSCGCK